MFTYYDQNGQEPEGQNGEGLLEEGEFVSGVTGKREEEEKLGEREDGKGDEESVEIKGLPFWVREVPELGAEVRRVVKVKGSRRE